MREISKERIAVIFSVSSSITRKTEATRSNLKNCKGSTTQRKKSKIYHTFGHEQGRYKNGDKQR